MDPEYYSDLSIILLVLFSCGFTILYWRIWLRVWRCLKTCFHRERLWAIVKASCRYVCQLPRRAYYAFYTRIGIAALFAVVFPDGTDHNFEDDAENQVIYDHYPEILSRNHDFDEPPIELVPLPGVGPYSTSSVYSSHPDLQQAGVYPPAHSATSRESEEDVLSSDADKGFVDSWVADWVADTAEHATTGFEEITVTTPAE